MSLPSQSPEVHRKTLKHYDLPGDAHFLTFSCYRRLALLSKPRTCLWFIEAQEAARKRHQFELWAWVIMPEHVHLLLHPRNEGYRTASILASLKKPVGFRAIEYLRANAPAFLERLTVVHKNRTYHRFWQAGAGQDHNVHDSRAAHEIVEYIHANPVRRGLAEHPEQWAWSSAADWAGVGSATLKVDRTMPRVDHIPH